MMRDRLIAGGVSGRWRALLCLLILPLFLAGSARADDFLYPSPDSAVYHENVLSAGSLIEVEAGTRISGNVHSNGNVDLKAGSAVAGSVSASGQILGSGTATGAKIPGAETQLLPTPFDEATARGLADRIVEGNATYDTDQVIDDVLFVDGDIRFRASVNGAGTVIASGSIFFDNVTTGHPVVLSPDTRLSFSAFVDISIGKGRPLRGVLVAGRDVVGDKAVDITGVMIAGRNLRVHQHSRYAKLVLDRFPPQVAITSPANGAFVNTPMLRVTGTVTADGILAGVTVNGSPAAVSGIVFTAEVPVTEGANEILVRAVDTTGKESFVTATVQLDTVTPVLTLSLNPDAGKIVGAEPPRASVAWSDSGSGVDLASLMIRLDGAPLVCNPGPASADCALPPLQSGDHAVAVQVRDRAGNLESANRFFSFVLDQVPPTVAISSPSAGALINKSAVRVTGTATDDSGVTSLTVNGQPAGLHAGAFSALILMPEGTSALQVVAIDEAGRQGSADLEVAVDSRPPALVVESPAPEQRINHPSVRVSGRVEDESGIAGLEVAGAPVEVDGGRFDAEVELQEGANEIPVRAIDSAGNAAERLLKVERFTLPQVEIDSPADLEVLASPTVQVQGRVSDPEAAVTVNGIAAVVAGDRFTAADVPLIEGGNILTATAEADPGRVGSDSINVVRDLTAPRLSIDYPRDGARLYEPMVSVSGLVNDIVAGSVNASEVTVTVGGRTAAVANRSFLAEEVPLAPGDNVISLEAVDESGNIGHAQITVHRETVGAPRVIAVSGDGQTGEIGSELAGPLIVAVIDAAGLPVPGKTVLFKVVGTDGALDGDRRQVSATTGLDGRALVRFTLGTRAGAGNQVVEAVASRFRGPAVFRASALPGAARLIVVDSGDQQVGAAGQALPRPLVAAVTDAGFNRLGGVRVVFRAVRGAGQFQNRQREIAVLTDSDGRAIVPFLLPPEGTTQVVEAVVDGLEGSPVAAFTSYGWAAGDSSQTAVRGIVLDNSNQPVPGVTLRILDTEITARTDAKGLFRIQPAPVGTIRLVVDGSTAERPGSWPDLEFVLTTVAGRDNDLGMPIYLLPLDLGSGVLVDETRGGTLTLPEVPGFALEILPGSVTFPGGSRSGVVSVTAVHSDKIPMVPNFGQQPRLIVTIQPAGARFDPPAPLTLPNLEGLRPGQITELYSFDHDLGHFVSIGPATVSEDGTVIRSNPGVGILKAGWHCGGMPGFTGSTHDCPICHSCILNWCTPDDAQPCDDKDECTINDKCRSGVCKGDPVEVRKIDGACVGAIGQFIALSADSNAPSRVTWQAPASLPDSGTGGSFLASYNSEGDFIVTAMCKASSQTKQVSTGLDCGNITPVLHEPEAPASTGGDWGLVDAGTKREAKYKGCAESTKWCFRLEEYTEEHGYGIDGTGAIDVTGPNDPAVTAADCQRIIFDFTPPPPGTPQGPPRTRYWSSAFTTVHERFHVTDVHDRITMLVFQDLQIFVSNGSNCTACKSAAPVAVFDAEKERLFLGYRAAMMRNAEQLAHDRSNPLYRALVAQIRQRARTEGWPVVCQ
jgi:hypothetical protein